MPRKIGFSFFLLDADLSSETCQCQSRPNKKFNYQESNPFLHRNSISITSNQPYPKLPITSVATLAYLGFIARFGAIRWFARLATGFSEDADCMNSHGSAKISDEIADRNLPLVTSAQLFAVIVYAYLLQLIAVGGGVIGAGLETSDYASVFMGYFTVRREKFPLSPLVQYLKNFLYHPTLSARPFAWKGDANVSLHHICRFCCLDFPRGWA